MPCGPARNPSTHSTRRAVYGTMGGEGQPQTQAALFTRKFYQGLSLEEAISRGRWLLGRTWGQENSDLKMEEDLHVQIGQRLAQRGHAISVVAPRSETMGHAGAIVIDNAGRVECATDPRSDGLALSASV